jgi:hypothetical protein
VPPPASQIDPPRLRGGRVLSQEARRPPAQEEKRRHLLTTADLEMTAGAWNHSSRRPLKKWGS